MKIAYPFDTAIVECNLCLTMNMLSFFEFEEFKEEFNGYNQVDELVAIFEN